MIPGLDGVLSPGIRSSELPQSRFAKPGHRGVADSSPRGRYRISPYPTAAGRSRSFSTGSVAFSRPQLASPFVHRSSPSLGYDFHQTHRHTRANNMSTIPDVDFEQLYQPKPSRFPGGYFDQDGLFIPSLAEKFVDVPYSSISSPPNTVNVLHSSSPARTRCEHHFAGSSKPPDLFGPLQDRPISPPPEDSDCEEDVVPRAQQLRFEGDLYTPKYVRGHGNKREGWCGICKPGRWLVLKNSAFWYDKSFTHGISAATGNAFEGPKQTRRMKGNPDVWEGLCHSCDEWIALISSKKKGTTWFRHAYKVNNWYPFVLAHAELTIVPVSYTSKGQGCAKKAKRRLSLKSRKSVKIHICTVRDARRFTLLAWFRLGITEWGNASASRLSLGSSNAFEYGLGFQNIPMR